MSVSFDDRDLRKLAREFDGSNRELTRTVDRLLDRHAADAAAEARAAAPSDRPWLNTPQGIVVSTPEPGVRRIRSPHDPKGESVGYRVEFGTSIMPPRPFLVPAARRASVALRKDLEDALAKVTLKR